MLEQRIKDLLEYFGKEADKAEKNREEWAAKARSKGISPNESPLCSRYAERRKAYQDAIKATKAFLEPFLEEE